MNYMKLLKLLYLTERKSLIEATKSISGDRLIAMKNGPLLSETYDLIKDSAAGRADGYWCERISTNGYDVKIKEGVIIDDEDLSEADELRLNQIYDQFGAMDEFELVDWTHKNLPEWSDPKGTSRAIPTRDIFYGAGLSEAIVTKKERDLYELSQFERLLSL